MTEDTVTIGECQECEWYYPEDAGCVSKHWIAREDFEDRPCTSACISERRADRYLKVGPNFGCIFFLPRDDGDTTGI